MRLNGAFRSVPFIGGNAISTEFTTVFFMIAFAGFLDRARGKGFVGLFTLIVLGGISVVPIVLQPRLSQALTLGFGYAVLAVFATMKGHFGGKKSYQFGLMGLTALFCGILTVSALMPTFRIERFLMWFDGADAFGRNYQSVQATRWLYASEAFGSATQKIDGGTVSETLPAATTDFALVNIFATLGWVVGVGLIILFSVYIIRLFAAALKIKNSFGHYLSLFACAVLSVQFIMGLAVNCCLFPAGSMIPFITYGGVGFISSMAAVGLVLSAWRHNQLIGAIIKRYH
jgi:cell division protein FtsW